ncbi:unnamed protein product [Absidia cylindrospora]
MLCTANILHESPSPIPETPDYSNLLDAVSVDSPNQASTHYPHGNLDNIEKAWLSLPQNPDFLRDSHKYRLESKSTYNCTDLIYDKSPNFPTMRLSLYLSRSSGFFYSEQALDGIKARTSRITREHSLVSRKTFLILLTTSAPHPSSPREPKLCLACATLAGSRFFSYHYISLY